MIALLFERAVRLVLLWLAVQFGLIAIWSFTRGTRSRNAVWWAFAALPILLALNVTVVTTAEHLEHICRRLAVAVDEGSIAEVRIHLADDFQADGLDREAFMRLIERALTRYRIEAPRLSDIKVSFEGDSNASVELTASAYVQSADAVLDRQPTRWRIKYRSRGEAWLITAIEVVPIPPLQLRRLGDITR